MNAQGSVNGRAGQMPAFYDGEQFTINTLEVSDIAGDRIVQNRSHNEIFVTNDLDDPQDFDPVLDAIQAMGSIPCGSRSRSSSARASHRTSSSRTRKWKTPPLPATSRWKIRAKCIVARWSAGSSWPPEKEVRRPGERPAPLSQ
jgi:hypothetical protein